MRSRQISRAPVSQAAFEPRIVAFFCNWCTYLAADLAGTSRMKYAPNVRVIRLMCSGRVDPQFVLDAFAQGADGVLIGGCHPGDCHYQEGNYEALRRYHLLKRVLRQMGIEEERFRLECPLARPWSSLLSGPTGPHPGELSSDGARDRPWLLCRLSPGNERRRRRVHRYCGQPSHGCSDLRQAVHAVGEVLVGRRQCA